MSSMKLSLVKEVHTLTQVVVPPSDPLAVGRLLLPQLGQGLPLFPASFVEGYSQGSGPFTSLSGSSSALVPGTDHTAVGPLVFN